MRKVQKEEIGMLSNLVRWSGLAAILGAVLWMVGITLVAADPLSPGPALPYELYTRVEGYGALLLIAVSLLVVGLIGLQLRQGEHTGTMGVGVLVLTLAGVALIAAFWGVVVPVERLFPTVIFPESLWTVFMLGFYGAVLGTVLTGAVALQAGVVPRWVAVLFIVCPIGMFFFNDQTEMAWLALLFGIPWIGLGFALWSGKEASPQRPARVR